MVLVLNTFRNPKDLLPTFFLRTAIMTTLIQAIILGIIQGITEWLPISSSGHLAIAEHLFGLDQPVVFDVMLHVGSLLVVLWVFREDLIDMISGIMHGERESLMLASKIFMATLPIAFVGMLFRDQIEALVSMKTIGMALILTSFVLFLSVYPRNKDGEVTWGKAAIMGFAQAVAIFPGVSRSGMTISAGLMQGVDREKAARFSFLLFIPAILGATIVELPNLSQVDNMTAMISGTIAAIVAGYFSLTLLLGIIKKGKFHHFGWYCLALGIIVLFFL